MITHPSSPQQLSCIAAEVVSVQALNRLAAESPAVAYEVSGDHLAHGMSRHSLGVLTPDEARAAVALSNDLDGQIGFTS